MIINCNRQQSVDVIVLRKKLKQSNSFLILLVTVLFTNSNPLSHYTMHLFYFASKKKHLKCLCFNKIMNKINY